MASYDLRRRNSILSILPQTEVIGFPVFMLGPWHTTSIGSTERMWSVVYVQSAPLLDGLFVFSSTDGYNRSEVQTFFLQGPYKRITSRQGGVYKGSSIIKSSVVLRLPDPSMSGIKIPVLPQSYGIYV